MDNLSPDMLITVSLKQLNDMVEKRSNEIVQEKLSHLDKMILEDGLDHKNNNNYIWTFII